MRRNASVGLRGGSDDRESTERRGRRRRGVAGVALAAAVGLVLTGCSGGGGGTSGASTVVPGANVAPSTTVLPVLPVPSVSGSGSGGTASGSGAPVQPAVPVRVVPEPASLTVPKGPGAVVRSVSAAGGPAATALAGSLAKTLHVPGGDDPDAPGDGVLLKLDPHAGTGAEGYTLTSGPGGVVVTAADSAGLFYGVQTLQQLLPAAPRVPVAVPAVKISDAPRYPYRGLMLDVVRHFFPVADVEHVIDLMAEYKLNYLHLHLTDDQGWRIQIPQLPRLTEVGSSTSVGGDPGGYYTLDDYKAIVAYAAARHVTVVPEIESPGHVSAALTAYPDLGCPGDGPFHLQTVTATKFTRICPSHATTEFLNQVFATLASVTPGPYLHTAGDEAATLSKDQYTTLTQTAVQAVRKAGKQPIAWEDATASGAAVLQVWHPRNQNPPTLPNGVPVILSPADHVYFDQKYAADSPLGLHWTSFVTTQSAYDWDPATLLGARAAPQHPVRGVEATIFTDTTRTLQQLEIMLLPRLPAAAEAAWTPQNRRQWPDFRVRLAAQAPRWAAQGLAWTRDPTVFG